ncbi:hypothetical protein [Streptomyces sp. NPDC091371]|uniref:hypothetical protein n=1 Tax=Streptomyces sp. NPDC091371 TaxID=3155303 RepID=UPI00341674AA
MWRINVDDPEMLVASSFESSGERPDLAGRTRQPMTELAASMGCVYEGCVDDDCSEDDVPYYAWWVRVPAAEQTCRGANGLLVAVDRLHRYLTAGLPYLPHWEILPDRERTVDHAASSAVRDAYDDLIAPFERALLPLRRNGAEQLEPRVKVWTGEKDLLIGTFDLWLSDDPDRPHTWLVASAGLWTESHLFEGKPAAGIGRFGFAPHHPLLLLTRPPGPETFTACVESGSLPGTSTSRASAADALGTAHQWTANDPAVLARRVARDMRRLWPHFTRPVRKR